MDEELLHDLPEEYAALGDARTVMQEVAAQLKDLHAAVTRLGDALESAGLPGRHWRSGEARVRLLPGVLPNITVDDFVTRLAEFAVDNGPQRLHGDHRDLERFHEEVAAMHNVVERLRWIARDLDDMPPRDRRSARIARAFGDVRVRGALDDVEQILGDFVAMRPFMAPLAPRAWAGSAERLLPADRAGQAGASPAGRRRGVRETLPMLPSKPHARLLRDFAPANGGRGRSGRSGRARRLSAALRRRIMRPWPRSRIRKQLAAVALVAVLGLSGIGFGVVLPRSHTPAATATPNPAAQIPGWKLIWWDEYDGPSLDTTKWSVVSDAPGGYQHCCLADTLNAWVSDDVSLVGGSLRLTTERRSFQGHAYTSGAVTTKGKFDFLYGRVDMRARLPRGNGLWPAFWLLPSDFAGSGYAPFEVDVMEALGQWPHTDFMVAWVGARRTGYCQYDGPDFTADYHVFSSIWTTTSISWLVDGTQRCKFTKGMPTVPMYLTLNTRIGGSWPVPPDASTVLPQYTDIDYVRVYTAA